MFRKRRSRSNSLWSASDDVIVRLLPNLPHRRASPLQRFYHDSLAREILPKKLQASEESGGSQVRVGHREGDPRRLASPGDVPAREPRIGQGLSDLADGSGRDSRQSDLGDAVGSLTNVRQEHRVLLGDLPQRGGEVLDRGGRPLDDQIEVGLVVGDPLQRPYVRPICASWVRLGWGRISPSTTSVGRRIKVGSRAMSASISASLSFVGSIPSAWFARLRVA